MKFRNSAPSLWVASILTAILISGCSYWDKSQTSFITEKLQRIIKQYNIELETHSSTMGSMFVKPEHVEAYINDVEQVRKRW